MMPFDEELESRSNKFHKIEIRLRVEDCLNIELRMNIQMLCNFDSYLDSTLEFVSRQFLSPTLLPRTFAKGIFTTTRGSTTPTVRFLLYKKNGNFNFRIQNKEAKKNFRQQPLW